MATQRPVFDFISKSALVGSAVACLMLTTSLTVAQDTPVEIETGSAELFSSRILTTGLSNPWEITWGPDDLIWVTERSSGEVTRIDPNTGAQQTLLTIEDVSVDVQHQGLLGMALHPELLQGTGNDFVYLVYTYETGTEADPDPRQKLVRYSYNQAYSGKVLRLTMDGAIPEDNPEIEGAQPHPDLWPPQSAGHRLRA